MKVLFVNCCIRGEASRTLRLCRVAIEAIHTTFPTAEVEELCLDQEALLPLHSDTLAQRHALEVAQAFDHPMFRYARQFAAADVILVGAPYWEYQFPALLRCYVEHISVSGLTFAYGEDGRPHGLCKGDRLFYLTTAGGPILDRNCGLPTEERKISVEELIQAQKEGKLEEVFGTGTAAVISPVGKLRYKDDVMVIGNGEIGPLSQKLYDTVTGIQLGRLEDKFGWRVRVD